MINLLAQTHELAGTAGDAVPVNEGVTLVASVCGLLAAGIAAVGVAVLVYGVAKAGVTLIRNETSGYDRDARVRLRLDLGYYLLLGLEILVAADVIETLMAPDLNHVLVLGAIVLIRTVISFSLNWELAHEKQHSESKQLPGVE